MFPPSPYTNPATKDLTDMERLRYNRTILQRAVPDATQNSILLALPAELRNQIYEMVLIDPEPINVDAIYSRRNFFDTHKLRRSTIKEPPILRTCCLFRTEATQIYYSSNKFTSRSGPSLYHWINGLSVAKRGMLVHVHGSSGRYDPNNALRAAQLLRYVAAAERLYCLPGFGVDVICIVTVGKDKGKMTLSRKEVVERMTEEEWDFYDNKRWARA